MSTKYLYFSGTAKWPRLVEPDEAFGGSFYKITVDLDVESQKVFAASGLRLEPKGDNGAFEVTFRRDTSRMKKDGSLVEFGPPKLFDNKGNPIEDRILVGNESDVTVKVEIYDTKKGVGHRLAAVRINKLVEYNPNEIREPSVF